MDHIAVLGPIEARVSGVRVAVVSPRQRALLARLTLARGRAVSVDTLVDDAWGTRARPRDSRAGLQVQMHRLRTLLGPLGELIATVSGGYRFDLPPELIDAEMFERQTLQGRELLRWNPQEALHRYDAALARWRGPAYAEFADTFAHAEAVRLQQLRGGVLEERIAALLAVGETTQAVADAEALISQDSLRERPYGYAMRALALEGRTSEALSLYQRLRKVLAEELGSEPSRTLEDLHLSLLRQESVAPAGPTAVAEPRLVGPAPHSSAVASFVGRQAELDELDRALARNGSVTLVGPPGVGKSRLAQELCARSSEVTLVRWVDFSSCDTGADVPQHFAASLGPCSPGPRGVTEAGLRAVNNPKTLLVLDNCEHVVDEVALLVARARRSCPQARVLVTSRERLAVEGEYVINVSPLPVQAGKGLAPAVRLFLDRIAAAGQPIDEQNLDVLRTVAVICGRLDGLPLALELAAGRVSTLGVSVSAGVADLLWLASGRRTDRSSHRSLRAAVSWSFDRLAADEQRLLRRLSVFAGWFSVTWASQVCADDTLPPGQIPALLASLVDKSLVSRRADPAPGMRGHSLLHTVQCYAEDQLEQAGEADVFRERHAQALEGWAVDLADLPVIALGAVKPVWQVAA
ncbi:AfsR/SARP family transcriptional regulator [Micromonospora auratinigra]|uniref:Predicted ATPase n=1 Tax=Micromonospora auratinigra TaxID=261654 RepID=A0A1A8Z4K0_9ACTN|nr:BTAD domain-containing putative transcriptional regulator [Micromonospora auratinigra]SBT38708.1 Predicted ATPase [Micromonospora auratinigra]